MKIVSFTLALCLWLLLAASAEASCYACDVLDSGDLTCERVTKSGYTNCVTWANRESIGCQTSGDSCGSGNGREPEHPVVRLDRCGEPRLVLVRVESSSGTDLRSLELVSVRTRGHRSPA